jgi:hypothetical protein
LTDQWDSDGTDNSGDGQQGNNGGGGLRKQLEQALEQLKTLKSENDTLKTQTRQTAISTVVTGKGYNAKVAQLIPNTVAPTAEAVQAWLDEYGDVFNVKKDDTAGSDSGGANEGAAGDVDPDEAMEYIQTMRQMGAVNGGMMPPAKANDLLAKISNPELTKEDLIQLINAHGGGVGMG